MPELDLRLITFLLFVGAFTIAAAVSDMRTRRIPNKMTVSMLAAGVLYRIAFFDLAGFGDGMLAFLLGFGTLFLLWMIGSGGGGDVKLMGSLSVWLGFQMTLWVLMGSVLVVIAGTGAIKGWSILSKGTRKTKKLYLGTGKNDGKKKPKAETVEQKQGRRVMAFAGPVVIATWAAVILKFAAFPWL